MPHSVGTKLGPYEVLSPIGAGGMGEVYRARDTRLNRIVAIKVSKEQFSERFEHEAQAVAALNHPNICQLYDVGQDYLVMEYVEGAPLKGPLPLEQALHYAVQICGALDAAHKKGIVHRDLKPANILATKTSIKLLDFGLAKLRCAGKPSDDATITMTLTGKNEIVGTLYYMSPEQLQAQASGREIDSRSDIFSFGLVLYEMLTGRRAFEGSSPASVIAAILERPAPSIVEIAPPALDRVLRKCLEKNPDDRWQTARDLKDELEWITSASGEVSTSSTPIARNRPLPWIAAVGVLAVVAAALAFVHLREPPPETPVVRFALAPPAETVFAPFAPLLSPDGRRIVFTTASGDGRNSLWVRSLDTLTAQPLVTVEIGAYPFWSPDSRSIGFHVAGKLKRIDVSGGPAVTLAEAPSFRGGTWNRNDVILFVPEVAGQLHRVAAAGGASSLAMIPAKPGGTGVRWPWFLPDGRHFLVAAPVSAGSNHVRILGGALDSQDVKTILEADSNAVYASGSLLYVRESTLMSQPFDPKSLVTTGPAIPVAENVRTRGGNALGLFSVSENGMMAYSSGESPLRLNWFDSSGKRLSTVGDPGSFTTIGLSPDGNRALVALSEHNQDEIWIYDLLRGLRTRFASDSRSPIWSPDGNTILFSSTRNGKSGLYRRASDGTGAEELLYADDPNLNKFPETWSPDGKFVLYEFNDPKTRNDIWVLPTTREHPGAAPIAHPWLKTAFRERQSQFSPDGRWVVYESDESGRFEVYVASFSGSGGKRQVSTEGGYAPRWRRDGKEILYVGPDRKLDAVEVNAKGATVETGPPHALPIPIRDGPGILYDVSADGQRILVGAPPEPEAAPGITVVQNWMAVIKK
jgi:Tol biopolymer transport system component/predicted Ser/Thr protein kinase